jgi:AraC-like DNA-binding protein/quercetin dioxygenase-like cupin family protein
MSMSVSIDIATPHSGRIAPDGPQVTSENFRAISVDADAGMRFEAHSHDYDQLAWMPRGAMELVIGTDRWHLRREHFAWIPASVPHEMTLTGSSELVSVYSDRPLRPRGEQWSRPLILGVGELGGALFEHLSSTELTAQRRTLCHGLLVDLLESAPDRHDTLALPRDPRARSVAVTIIADPSDPRELLDWADELGVSTKTLMRAFAAETGCTFGQWRTRARMYAAVRHLAAGHPVHSVAGRVGYGTSSGFITAFRSTFGVTPARYARHGGAQTPRDGD